MQEALNSLPPIELAPEMPKEEATEDEHSVCYVTSCDKDGLEMAIEALEKQVPMKLDSEAKARGEYFCNNCYEPIPRWDTRYCPYCGQKIDWE